MNRWSTADLSTGRAATLVEIRKALSRLRQWNWQASESMPGVWTTPCWESRASFSKSLPLRDRRTDGHGEVSGKLIGRKSTKHGHPVHAHQHFVSAVRRSATNSQALAAAKYLLTSQIYFTTGLPEMLSRIYRRHDYADGGPGEARVGHRPDAKPGTTGSFAVTHRKPGSIIGTLLPDIAGHSSLAGTTIIAPACHDTGSAVAAISARDVSHF